MATGNLESVFSIWFSTDRFNGLNVKQAALEMKEKKGWELTLFAAVWVAERPFILSPLILSYPQTWQHLSGVWLSPHQTKHKDLLLYCYSTVKDSWLHPHNPQNLHAEGWQGLSITSWPWGRHQESRRLCWILIHCSNYYFFLILTDFLLYLSQVEVLASHLALEPVLCKHTFGGCDFHPFCSVFTHPSVLLFIRTV